ncbi:MAG: hypothetical protein RIF32_23235 [Leptospirales bacterium]|jgi:hypothetical protein
MQRLRITHDSETRESPLTSDRPRRATEAVTRTVLCCALFFSTAAACDSRSSESDAEDDRNQLIVLSSLLTNATNFEAACQRSVASGFACAENTGLGQTLARESYGRVMQLVLELPAAPDSSSAEKLCDDLYISPALVRATGATRVCWFQCETNFWNAALAANPGVCGALDYANLAARAPGEIFACFNSCVSATTRFYY